MNFSQSNGLNRKILIYEYNVWVVLRSLICT